jgi:cyanophycin synthetase
MTNTQVITEKVKWKLIRIARRFGYHHKIKLNIPSAFVTGSIGKTTTCRMLAAILAENGIVVGLSTTQGVFLGKEIIRLGDSSNCRFASRVLLHRRVQAGVFELARGGLLNQGVVFNGCDVGAVLNVYDNHLGLGGINTREQMADLKSAVVMSARKMAVINADDPLCLKMRVHIVAPHTCLVSMCVDNPVVLSHMKAGGFAAFLNHKGEPAIHLYKENEGIGSIAAADLPASYDGRFRPALFNALFAMALAYGMGVQFAVIRKALKTFQSTEETNPGRMNFYDHLPFRVLITWADGPQALEELGRFIQGMNVSGDKYLMFCAMGNRPDQFIKDTGKSAAGIFTHYICSDYIDLRGRPPGETAELLSEGLKEKGIGHESITVASSHQNALDVAFSMPSMHDLLVVCTYAFDAAKTKISGKAWNQEPCSKKMANN